MEKYIKTERNTSIKSGKVFEGIANIMANLKVARNGTEIDKETGEIKYRYIKIEDMRSALNPLLQENKLVILKESASKFFRDRKQNKWGTWVNIDVVENVYKILSLEDGSYITATGRGEGSDWGDSSVTLAEAEAYKNFVGTVFCLVTEEDTNSESKTEAEEKPKRKRRTKAEMEADSKVIPPITNEVVEEIEKNIDPNTDEGQYIEVPEEAKKAESISEPIESITEEITEEVPFELKEKEEVKEEIPEEPTEEIIAEEDELKGYANIVCPIPSAMLKGKTFEELCKMAISNNTDAEKKARQCLVYISNNPSCTYLKDNEDFYKACVLATKKLELAS